MKEATWIIDSATGALTVEGMSETELVGLASDLLPTALHVNCARPVNVPPLHPRAHASTASAESESLQVYRIYHGSVVEGEGRRSVVQVAGCSVRCPHFIYSLKWAKYDAAHERHQQRTTHTRRLVLV